ncbi:MAG: AMP-binding protein, partial [Candidatus Omnitrophica bacterium]|nr:AMP-binding protein [Candidatus Omnitrophota bacterium]
AKAKKYPDKSAYIFRGQPISFLELKNKSFQLANGLKSLGIKKGDKVAIYLPNWPEYIYGYLAAWCLGATVVPLDFMLTEDELVSCITHSEASILLAKNKANVSLLGIKNKCPGIKNICVCQEEGNNLLSLEGLINQSENKNPAVEIRDRDYAIIFYTSGTTGRPKGVLVNYLQLSAPPKAMECFVEDLSEDDVGLCSLPFSHLGGLIYIQNNLVYGISVVLMERFIPSEFLKNIEKYKITCFWMVPSMYYALLQMKEFETTDLSSLRWIDIFGAPSSPDALRRFHQYCPKADLLHGWGLTETNAPTTVIKKGSDKIGSVGKPAPWIEVKIFSDQDKELPAGEIGEIVVKGWVVTDGYYKDPEATSLAMRSGWFHTGDLGRFDNDADLYIVGRKKEMIKVSGEIVFEPEVEASLLKNPEVAEVAVIGAPDELRGEVPKAFIVLKEGSKLSAEDLRYFLGQHLAHFKIPHYFEFVKMLPKNRTGKINKETLRNP